ncbi:MAG: MBL fold metallo-hydrolase, partial [bacterium]|nr:MBL fold metallo-hydrolase [bacterium]
MEDYTIKSYTVGFLDTNMYLVIRNRSGIIIDPGFLEREKELILSEIRAHCDTIPVILLTHCHFDHIMGCAPLVETFKSRVFCHKLEQDMLTDAGKNGGLVFGFHADPLAADQFLEDKQELSFLDLKFRIIHTPGHSRGSVCILLEDKYLFSGDTIMQACIGRTDLYNGSYKNEIHSIKNKL